MHRKFICSCYHHNQTRYLFTQIFFLVSFNFKIHGKHIGKRPTLIWKISYRNSKHSLSFLGSLAEQMMLMGERMKKNKERPCHRWLPNMSGPASPSVPQAWALPHPTWTVLSEHILCHNRSRTSLHWELHWAGRDVHEDLTLCSTGYILCLWVNRKAGTVLIAPMTKILWTQYAVLTCVLCLTP